MAVYREFVVPSDEEIIEEFGVIPEVVSEFEAKRLDFSSVMEGGVVLTYDALARSIAIIWKNFSGEVIVDIFKEGATRMSVVSFDGTSQISLRFDSGEVEEELFLQIFPRPKLTGRGLFS
ncbi:hypothetical protein [Streptomyces sp. ST2-7A]|uniref:hypothetical protein n=1 Tax=Streptomyces sp. ST2-7A TaxID=2907214 RepID=UPI001F27D609|nr:hypothetical protein [Streptomyces sp. ST2-7A]MCE7081594.1 hypothetical protein [Streptomyces sp. ST2-7A]